MSIRHNGVLGLFPNQFLQRGQSTTLDFKSAAAMPEFNPVDPLAHVSGKKAVAG